MVQGPSLLPRVQTCCIKQQLEHAVLHEPVLDGSHALGWPAAVWCVCCRPEMNTPFHYPSLTFQQLKDISKSRGKRWSHERSYRNDCIDVIHRTCDALHM